MTPRRREQDNYAAALAILIAAALLLGLALLIVLPILSGNEGAAIQRIGTPIAALATVRALTVPIPTATPRPTATVPAPTATSQPTETPQPTDTPAPSATATVAPPPNTATAVAQPAATWTPGVASPATSTLLPAATWTPVSPPPTGIVPTRAPSPAATVRPPGGGVGPTATPSVTEAPPAVRPGDPTGSSSATAAPSLASLSDPTFLAGLAARVIALTNQQRARYGLPSLTPDDLLDRIARKRSQDMIARDYFGHYDPVTGKPAVVQVLDSMIVPYHEVGENIVENRNMLLNNATSAQVVEALMHSKEHRDNILDATYAEIGVGLAVGEQNGAFRVVFTQVFLS